MASDPDLKFEFIVDVPRVDFHHPYWSEFKSFIKKMRLELQEKGRYSHDRPVLPLQRKPPTEWFHITLKTKEHPEGITLRIRRDNIYLDGYRMEDSGQWFEFDGPEQLIPGSTFLGFNGSYPSLEREGGRKDSIKLGQSELIVAVHDLATSTNKRMRAVALIIVIQMICESIRYDSILDQIVKKLRAVLPPPVMELENNWDKLSGALLSADDNQVVDFSKFDKMNIRTEKEAAAAVGMVLGLEEQDLDPLPSRKGRANKLVVGCYSFWQANLGNTSYKFLERCAEVGSLFNSLALLQHNLLCSQVKKPHSLTLRAEAIFGPHKSRECLPFILIL